MDTTEVSKMDGYGGVNSWKVLKGTKSKNSRKDKDFFPQNKMERSPRWKEAPWEILLGWGALGVDDRQAPMLR